MQGGRDRGAVKGVLQDYLVTDEVVASTAQTMEDTLRFLDTRYGGIKQYLKVIGITKSEVGRAARAPVMTRRGASTEVGLTACRAVSNGCVVFVQRPRPWVHTQMSGSWWNMQPGNRASCGALVCTCERLNPSGVVEVAGGGRGGANPVTPQTLGILTIRAPSKP